MSEVSHEFNLLVCSHTVRECALFFISVRMLHLEFNGGVCNPTRAENFEIKVQQSFWMCSFQLNVYKCDILSEGEEKHEAQLCKTT